MNCSNTRTERSSPQQTRPRQPALLWLKRQRLLIGGLAIAALGLVIGWNELAAIGALPILLSTVPCLIMMGLCMKSMQSCSKKEQSPEAADTPTTDAPAHLPGPSAQRIKDQDHA